MSRGTLSIIDDLSQRLLRRWVPKWYEAFRDPLTGGFYERLGAQFKPVSTGRRRLLTQCRQLALYSHAATQLKTFRPALAWHFEKMSHHYEVPHTGGWRFSVADDGTPHENHYDLYAQSFVIFACSHYHRATADPRARQKAVTVRQFIERHFRLPDAPGYAEALDEELNPIPQTRRQNPHMHLLEACLFAAETWPDDPDWLMLAAEMVALFRDYFYRRDDDWLCEFFDDQLQPDAQTGRHVEPGHYCEWVWLLKKHAALSGDAARHDADCAALLRWANRYGWDSDCGGIYDVLDPSGTVVQDSKRIWPFTEALKANALMLDSGFDKETLKARMADMVRVFREGYMDERGFWVESLCRDLSPATDYMPGTTPYHVYFGIMETRAALAGRGQSKSWRAGPGLFAYALRRHVSDVIKGLRNNIRR